tara:strand:+ start:695 stop:1084 length:390 start_codon:yes stop_codon:yes gene_type:complete
MNQQIEELAREWESAKSAEAKAVAIRRAIEDELTELLALPKDLDGSKNENVGQYKIKVTGRLDRKINSDKLQELAQEAGLSDHLGSLFRWKPEINMTAWKAAHESITAPLLDAITTTAGRPSYAITRKD